MIGSQTDRMARYTEVTEYRGSVQIAGGGRKCKEGITIKIRRRMEETEECGGSRADGRDMVGEKKCNRL